MVARKSNLDLIGVVVLTGWPKAGGITRLACPIPELNPLRFVPFQLNSQNTGYEQPAETNQWATTNTTNHLARP